MHNAASICVAPKGDGPTFAVRSEDPVQTGEVDGRPGHLGHQPAGVVDRFEDDVGGTVPVGRF